MLIQPNGTNRITSDEKRSNAQSLMGSYHMGSMFHLAAGSTVKARNGEKHPNAVEWWESCCPVDTEKGVGATRYHQAIGR